MQTEINETGKKGSALLKAAEPARSVFDPTNKADQIAYLVFMRTGRWTKKYVVEWPAVTVPQTIQTKLLLHFLQPVQKNADSIIKNLGITESVHNSW